MPTSSSQLLSFNLNTKFIITVPPTLAARPDVLQMSWFEILLKKEDSLKNSHLFPYLQIKNLLPATILLKLYILPAPGLIGTSSNEGLAFIVNSSLFM